MKIKREVKCSSFISLKYTYNQRNPRAHWCIYSVLAWV